MAQELVSAHGALVDGLSQVERVVDTFVAPSKTFADILRSTSWWLPFLLMTLGTLLVANTVQRKVGFARVYQNQVAASPKMQDALANASPEQKAMMVKMGPMQYGGTLYLVPVFLTIGFFIYSLMLWASFNFGLGAQTTYWQVLAVSWYAALPYLVISLITFLTVQFGNDPDAYDLKNPVGTNLAYYLPNASPMVKGALASIDVVKLWSVVLQVIGMAVISRKTMMQSAVVVGIFWLLALVGGTVAASFS